MRRKYIILLMVLYAVICKGQDVITLKTGEQIKAKVQEVGTDEIKYKKFGIDDSPVYSIKKSEINQINYQNGTVDVFTSKESAPITPNTGKEDYYGEGAKDAEKYYAAFTTPAATGTFWTSLLVSVGGLVPAIACSSTQPKDRNLHMRQTPLKDNNDYMNGYRDEAFRIKKRRVWINFGVGLVIGIAASIALSDIK